MVETHPVATFAGDVGKGGHGPKPAPDLYRQKSDGAI